MSDVVIDQEFIDVVAELVDTIALTSETDFESGEISYEVAKMLIIQQMIPLMLNILNDENATSAEKFASLTAAMSHLSLENFFLHAEVQKIRRPH